MQRQAKIPRLARYLIAFSAITLLIFGLCALAWVVFDQHTLAQYGTIIMLGGIALICFGGMSGIGAFEARMQDTVELALTRHSETSSYLNQFSADMSSRLGCLALLVAEGALLLIVGSLLGGDPLPSSFSGF